MLERLRGKSFGYILRAGVDWLIERLLTKLWTLWFQMNAPLHNVTFRRGIEVFGRVIVRSPRGRIDLGEHVQLISSSWRCSASGVAHPVRLRTFAPSARIVIGKGSGMSGGSITARSQTIAIAENVLIGPDCLLVDSDFHAPWPPEERGNYGGTEHDAGITIGSNVWLGARCIILKGVSIGENSIIGAGSVVVKSLPANCLAAGNPAKVIKTFDEVTTG